MQVNRVQSPNFQGLVFNTAARKALEKETTVALKHITEVGRSMKDYKYTNVIVGENLQTLVNDTFDKFIYGKICDVKTDGNILKVITEKEMPNKNGIPVKQLITKNLNFATQKDAIAASDEFISPGDNSFGRAVALAKVIEKSHNFETGTKITSKEMVDKMLKEFESFTI